MSNSIHDFQVKNARGKDVNLADYKEKIHLKLFEFNMKGFGEYEVLVLAKDLKSARELACKEFDSNYGLTGLNRETLKF